MDDPTDYYLGIGVASALGFCLLMCLCRIGWSACIRSDDFDDPYFKVENDPV